MHEIAVSREVKNLGHRNAASLIRKAAEKALAAENVQVPCLISVMLTDEEGIHRVNREFRGVDRETDVLSFPLNELTPGAFDPEDCERDWETGAVMLGDMMISIPACEKQGEEFGHGFEREIKYLTPARKPSWAIGTEKRTNKRVNGEENEDRTDDKERNDYHLRQTQCRQIDTNQCPGRGKNCHRFQ